MAIDNSGISSLDAGASDITYSGNEGPKSPQEEQQMQMQQQQQQQQMMMAQLEQEYEQYRIQQIEIDPSQVLSFEDWYQSEYGAARAGVAGGGRIGFQGGGADYMPTDPRPMGNPGITEEIENAREFRIANPDIEDVADYKGYYERLRRKKLQEMMRRRSGAYGGTAHPTYTQSRKQRINAAGGGIMGSNAGSMLVAQTADGSRPGYGKLSDWKNKFIDDIIPNEIKDNPMLTAAITGGLLNQFGVPFTGTPGDRMGQNWLGELLSKVPGTGKETIDMVLGGDRGPNQIGLGQGIGNIFNTVTGQGGGGNKTQNILQTIGEGIKGLPGSIKNIGKSVFGLGQDPYDEQGQRNINCQTPLAIGATAGAIQAATPKTPLPQDTSGIDIADIRSRALTGSDPGLHFLPKGEATTAYAQGGRTGYYAGDRVEQNMITAFSSYKNAGGRSDFNEWFSDIYLPEATRQATSEMGEEIASTPTTPDEIDPWAEGAPYGYAPAGTRGSIDILYPGQAQGGRIGYKDGGKESWRNKLTRWAGGPNMLAGELGFEGLNQLYNVLGMGGLYSGGGRIGAQEGGLMNLGGMEKDYRQEGGFVPLGGEERADDVPARLSKNEFVFTADAVRSAGGGDIDAGAEVMENLMNNLEQGGQVSEESQGLEGARDMFATAQRLEGVL